MIKVTVPNLATLLIVVKKEKISEIASRYAESAAQIDQEIGKLKEPEDEHYEYGRAVANKLRCMTVILKQCCSMFNMEHQPVPHPSVLSKILHLFKM